MRWWDGTAWTEHLTMPEPAGPVVQASYQPEYADPAPTTYAATPYVPFARTSFVVQGDRTPELTYTAAVWWVALAPAWFVVLGVIIAIAVVLVPGLASAVIGFVLVVGGIFFSAGMVMRDRRQLMEAGYHKPPSVWWWLLTPLAYLIARGVYMFNQKRRGWAPAIVLGSLYFASIVYNSYVILSALTGRTR